MYGIPFFKYPFAPAHLALCGAVLCGLMLSGCGASEPEPSERKTPPAVTIPQNNRVEEISWEVLIPEDWSPDSVFAGTDIEALQDNDPKAQALLSQLREAWDNAPMNTQLQGRWIRIPGYVVPLDQQPDGVREFLLVPYFGACIHVPPPPANQIIHVSRVQPTDLQTMTPVWVEGQLELGATETEMGRSGYRLHEPKITPYIPNQDIR